VQPQGVLLPSATLASPWISELVEAVGPYVEGQPRAACVSAAPNFGDLLSACDLVAWRNPDRTELETVIASSEYTGHVSMPDHHDVTAIEAPVAAACPCVAVGTFLRADAVAGRDTGSLLGRWATPCRLPGPTRVQLKVSPSLSRSGCSISPHVAPPTQSIGHDKPVRGELATGTPGRSTAAAGRGSTRTSSAPLAAGAGASPVQATSKQARHRSRPAPLTARTPHSSLHASHAARCLRSPCVDRRPSACRRSSARRRTRR
jgi:hypothetical protein